MQILKKNQMALREIPQRHFQAVPND